ncbi:MAG: glycosyltransferase family 2 protein [Saprospiraceae bacterium]
MLNIKKYSLSIVVPAYNEENTVTDILDRLRTLKLQNASSVEVLIINDASTDKTRDKILAYKKKNPDFDLKFLEHKVNQGKGAALHTGFAHADNDYTVVQDADLEYDPTEIDLLFGPVVYDKAEVVYGSRFMGGNAHRILFFWHSLGNKFLTFLANMSTNLNLTDMETCYKLIKTDILKSLDLKEKRFGFEPEVTARLSRIPKIKIYEVGISYYGRTYEEGKKINWKDGVRAIYCIIKYGFLKF